MIFLTKRRRELFKIDKEYKYRTITIAIVMGFVLIFSATVLWLFKSFKEIALNSISDAHNSLSRELDYIYDTVNVFISDYGEFVFNSEAVQKLMMERFYSSKLEHENQRKHLLEMIKKSDFVDDVYILDDFNGYVYSTDAECSEVQLSRLKNYFIKDLFIHRSGIKLGTPILCHSDEDNAHDYYAFIFYNRNEQNYPLPGMLVLTVKNSWYSRALLNDGRIDHMLILDYSGNILAASSDEIEKEYMEDSLGMLSCIPKQGRYEDEQSDRISFCYSAGEDKNTYIKSGSLKVFLPKLMHMQNIFFAILLVLLAIFLMLVGMLVVYAIMPLFQMEDAIKTIKDIQSYNNQATNDRVYAKGSIKGSSLKEELGAVLTHSKRVNLNQMLYDMLNGSIEPNPLLLFGEAENNSFILNRVYGLMLVMASHRRDIYQAVQEKYPMAVVSKYFNTYWLCGVFDDAEDFLICQELIHERLGVTCFLSDTFNDFDSIIEHSKRLFELYKLINFLPDKAYYEETELYNKVSDNPIDSKDYAYLKTRLKTGNADAFKKKWEQILDTITDRRYDTIQYVYNRCRNLFLACLKEIEVNSESPRLKEKIEEYESVDELYTAFDECLPKMEEHFLNKSLQKTMNLSDNVAEYIEQNYSDENLSAAIVAEHFNMNTAYLNRLFKASKEMSMGDYINSYRIEKAKLMLKDTDMTIEEIAQSLGFSNKKYFYVLFKKLKGMTPKEYRMNN